MGAGGPQGLPWAAPCPAWGCALDPALLPLGICGMRGRRVAVAVLLPGHQEKPSRARPERLVSSSTSKGLFNPFLQSTEGEQVWKCNREASKRAFRSFIWKAIGEKNIASLNSNAEIYLFSLVKGEMGQEMQLSLELLLADTCLLVKQILKVGE